MNRITALTFWLAAASLVFACPQFSRAQDMNNAQSDPSAEGQAVQMVPAQAALATSLDARTMQPGTQFQATLNDTIHLKNGTELPHGTRLVGTVSSDSMTPQAKSVLALRFTQAQLKDGKVVPIKATITDLHAGGRYGTDPLTSQPNLAPWDGKSLTVDDLDVVSGVDLHSRIAGNNSGVFVSNTKDDVKLQAGSQMELAIAAQG